MYVENVKNDHFVNYISTHKYLQIEYLQIVIMDFLTKCKYHNYRKNNPQFNVPLVYNSELTSALYIPFELSPPPQTVFRRQYSIQPSGLIHTSYPSHTSHTSYTPPTQSQLSSHWPVSSQQLHASQTSQNVSSKKVSNQSVWESMYNTNTNTNCDGKSNDTTSPKRIRFANQSSVMLIPTRHEYNNKSDLWWTTSEIKTMFILKQKYPGEETE